MSDLDFMGGTGGQEEIDPAYKAMLEQAAQQQGMSEEYTGSEALPKFDHYIWRVTGADAREAFEEKVPEADWVCTVVEGPVGTVGRTARLSRLLTVGKNEKDASGLITPKSPEKYAEHVKAHIATQNRIAQALGLAQALPQSTSMGAVKAWAGIAVVAGKLFKAAAYPDKNGFARIVANSVAALEWPSGNKKYAGKSVGEVAREQIAAYATKQAAGKGGGKQTQVTPTGFGL